MTINQARTKADQVYERLRAELINGKWPFGTPFSTYDLAYEFELSRRPVMDAVARLAVEGFVEVIPQVGCRVVVPDERIMRDHFEFEAALEGAATRLVALRGTATAATTLSALHESVAAAVEAGDASNFGRLDRQLHTAILELSGNRRLLDLAAAAWDLRDFYLLQIEPPSAAELARLHHEHAAILEAIGGGRAESARSSMERHLARLPDRLPLVDH